MPRYIDADALYEQTAEWEARAIAHVEELNRKPLDEMTIEELEKWRKWSYILHERTAFKYDVADAPTANVVSKEQYEIMLEHANILAEEMRKYQNSDVPDWSRKKCQ